MHMKVRHMAAAKFYEWYFSQLMLTEVYISTDRKLQDQRYGLPVIHTFYLRAVELTKSELEVCQAQRHTD
jgi:hypothetical protein